MQSRWQAVMAGVAVTLLAVPARGAMAPFEIQKPDYRNYTFEGGVPEEFQAGAGSAVTIDTNLFKDGHASLRWHWTQPDVVLSYRCPEAFRHLTGQDPDPIVYEWVTSTTLSALNFWLFNETAGEDELWMEIGAGTNTDCRFSMKLNFSGWREFRAMYGRDLPAFPKAGADTLRFIAPPGRPSGTFHFDLFQPRREMDVRQVRGTAQTPWVSAGAVPPHAARPTVGRDAVAQTSNTPSRIEVAVPATLTDGQLASLKRFTAAVLEPYGTSVPPKPAPVSPGELDRLRALHATRTFSRDGERISGGVGPIGGNGAYVATAGDKTFWGEAVQFAAAWGRTGEQPEARKELEDFFMDYVDLCIQHGSGGGYATRDSFARPVLWMKEPLIRRGRFEPLIAKLRAMIGVDGIYASEPIADADVYNTGTDANLFLIAIQDDPRAKYRDLKALQHWLDRTAHCGEIRPDGSFFHHSQTYSGYNVPAIGPLVRYNHLLTGTEFYASASHAMARRVAYAMNFYSCNGDVPHTLGGRWRGAGSFTKVGLQIFWQLAECGTPLRGGTGVAPVASSLAHPLSGYGQDARATIQPAEEPERSSQAGLNTEHRTRNTSLDREMASIHLYYCALAGKDDAHAVRYRAMGITPWKSDGHLSLNYTVASVHRRADWMVFFRGQRNPFFSTESYAVQAGNTMGRYLNYGHMSVVSGGTPPTEAGSGTEMDKGWNFNFWPGTTAREIPFEALRSHFNVEEFLTAETFAAGTSLDGDGIFGMKLQEELPGSVDPKRIGPTRYWLGEAEYDRRVKDSMYDPTFRARKSVFCFDNRIVCLGSDIRAEDRSNRVCTTLFQHCVTGKQCSVFSEQWSLESKECSEAERRQISDLDAEHRTRNTSSNAVWLIDRNGDGYYVAAGNDPIEYSRAYRKLPYHSHWNPADTNLHARLVPNEGDTELAILDHGAAPQGKGYEYCIVMRSTSEAMGGFASQFCNPTLGIRISDSNLPPYVVMQRNRQAHIVWDRDSRSTGHVIFDPAWRTPTGPELPSLRASSASSTVHRSRFTAGSLLSASKPCLVMLRETAGGMRLSVCDPEIGGDPIRGVATPTRLQLNLRGIWRSARDESRVRTSVSAGNTVLDVTCREALPVVVDLTQGGR